MLEEQPSKVDVIVILSGESGRLEKGLELYEIGYSQNIILSNSNAFKLSSDFKSKVPTKNLFYENKALSTYDNATYTGEIMDEQNFVSAIVVSADYHMRRVKSNFERVNKNNKYEFIYVGSKTEYTTYFWWSKRHNIEITLMEYTKIVGNFFGIHGSEAKRKLYQYGELIRGFFESPD